MYQTSRRIGSSVESSTDSRILLASPFGIVVFVTAWAKNSARSSSENCGEGSACSILMWSVLRGATIVTTKVAVPCILLTFLFL